MPTNGVWTSPKGTKTFIPLENNPQVFASLVHDLGVSSELSFHDVYSLDDEALLSMVPRPVLSLIFITPGPMYYACRQADGMEEPGDNITYDKTGDEEPVLWFRQTIGHACGLIALLHSVANGEARRFVKEGSLLDRLLREAAPLKPIPRADLLYNSRELEETHMRAANLGDTSAPAADEGCGYHFIAFTKGSDGHLWELEGVSDGPVDRGLLPDGADMLSSEALERGVRKYLQYAQGNCEFSLVALTGPGDSSGND